MIVTIKEEWLFFITVRCSFVLRIVNFIRVGFSFIYGYIYLFIVSRLLAIDNAFDREAKYIALLYLDLFKPLRLFSIIKEEV